MENIILIAESVLASIASIWYYLLITIPLAIAVKVSGVSGHISRVFNRKPLLSILLATFVGAFSPFCSCSVVPLIATLLIGGVPLAPVMAFWIASPSVDPELLPLSMATIGFNLSVWRVSSSLIISLIAGFTTHYLIMKGYLGKEYVKAGLAEKYKSKDSTASCTTSSPLILSGKLKTIQGKEVSCCVSSGNSVVIGNTGTHESCATLPDNATSSRKILMKKILHEAHDTSLRLIKFMTLAFLISAIIKVYVPQDFLNKFLQMQGSGSVLVATLIGIPTYTSNMMALPLIGEFLQMGMSPGAALAFLLAGPVTTIPSILVVWGLTRRKVFFLYLLYSIAGALFAGFAWNLINLV